MTKKDLFRLIIKIFGLYSIVTTLFSSLPGSISWAAMGIDLRGIIVITATVLVIILLFVFLVYMPDKVIGLLNLDKGFDDERSDFQSLNQEGILKLSIIIIGGLVFIENVPEFLSHSFFAFKASNQSDLSYNAIVFGSAQDYIYWGTSFLNIIVGYILLTNYTYITKLLSKKS